MKQDEPFRMSDDIAEPPSPGEEMDGAEIHRGSGFGDKKKVAVLGILLVAGIGLGAYQFLHGSSPKTASAMTAAITANGAAAHTTEDIEGILTQMEATASSDDGFSVAKIEQFVKEFDGYVARRQVPLASLAPRAFQVVQPPAEKEKPALGAAAPRTVVDQAALRRQRIREAASRLVLGCVVLAGERRSAMINGKLYAVGDAVEGFEVKAIERDRVRLDCEGETADLGLGTSSPKGGATRGTDGR